MNHLNTRSKPRAYSLYIGLGAFLLVALIMISALAYGRSGGITGVTGPTAGCTCHNTNPNTSTSVTVSSQTGSFTVNTGSTTTFTVTVSNSNRSAAGVDIAVKTTETGETNAGTLEPADGSGLETGDGELTHSTPKAMQSGQASFSFTWTAPTTPGTYYLRAVGNAVNENGENDNNDQWNRMTVQAITVQSAPEVTVTSPNGTEAWCAGTSRNITWTSSGVQNVKIELSSNGGQTYPDVLAESVQASLNSWAWNIPANQPDGSQYRIRISDASNAATNDASNSNFSISTGVTITAQPQAATVCQGQTATLSVTATGGGLTYVWRKNGTNIDGANQATYNIPNVQPANAGNYDVIVTGACGTPVTSTTAALTINETPAITTQPVSREACLGFSTTFTVAATGTGISYQWRHNQQNIDGATNQTYTINSITETDEGSYDVVVTGTCTPAVTSNPAVLTINDPPAIITQPQPVTACIGTATQFKVLATGSGMSFQWRHNGANINGATDSVLVISPVTADDAGNYDVRITGICALEIMSQEARLTIGNPAVITSQPKSKTVVAGSSVTLEVIAGGSDIQYQWRKDGEPLSGETQSTLVLNNVTAEDAGGYDVLLTTTCGTIASALATITVTTNTNGPLLSLAAGSVDFGVVKLGSMKDTVLTSIITNSGNETLNISGISISGTDAANFELLSPSSDIVIGAGESANIQVRFQPTTGGLKTASLDFQSNSPDNPSLDLMGSGGFIAVSTTQSELDFGSTSIGSSSERILSIQNIGNLPAVFGSLQIQGPQASYFEIVSPNTPSSMEPGTSQQITVRFTPQTSGQAEAELSISIDEISQPLTITLRGNGITSVFDNEVSAILNLKAYPNPAAGDVALSFDPAAGDIYELSVIDIYGNTVRSYTIDADMGREIRWDGRDATGNLVPSGVYRIALHAAGGSSTIPVLITR